MKPVRILYSLAFLLSLSGALFFAPPGPARAETVEEIKAQIDAINDQRAALEEEIAGYQKQLNVIAGQKQTLQSTIQTLDVSRTKTAAQIKDIQKKMDAATLKLSQLSLEIKDKEDSISLDQQTVAASIRAMASADEVPVIEQLLSSEDLATAWTAVDNLSYLAQALRTHAAALAEAKKALAAQHEEVANTKTELASANADLASQKKALDLNREGKQQLLTQTQSQEGQYQALIAQKQAQQKAFESQLFAFESKLKQALDPSLIPSAGSGILAYPLDDHYVTQYFGATVDAKRLYVSGSHGGVDFRAAIGTPVKAALAGVVTDTEAVKFKSGCQYGKFVLIKHANGLSTIYGHLSSVSVTPGQKISTGQVIGYSGDTGYATGPHLHFGVYATQGIQIVTADQLGSVNCAGIKTVAASPEAYLDPMLYL